MQNFDTFWYCLVELLEFLFALTDHLKLKAIILESIQVDETATLFQPQTETNLSFQKDEA